MRDYYQNHALHVCLECDSIYLFILLLHNSELWSSGLIASIFVNALVCSVSELLIVLNPLLPITATLYSAFLCERCTRRYTSVTKSCNRHKILSHESVNRSCEGLILWQSFECNYIDLISTTNRKCSINYGLSHWKVLDDGFISSQLS
jgi:hypothetical protein